MFHLRTFSEFVLFEGGKALDSVRPIKQSEVPATVKSIEDTLFPVLKLREWNKDVLLIGSAGKKADPEETSGDIDLGIAMDQFFENNALGGSIEDAIGTIYTLVKNAFPEWEIKWMKGLEVISIAFPIGGDIDNGCVQLDLLPLKDMDWAKFIYTSPDYRKNESRYKSAHRNWLFAAVLSAITEDHQFDDAGNKLGFTGYMMRLNDGLSKIKKSYVGKKGLKKTAEIVKGEERLITKSPKEFVQFVFGEKYAPDDVRTFEDAIHIINAPDFKWKDKKEEILENYVRFLNRVKLPIPAEVSAK
jgi:hypothetical protein